MMDQAPRIVTAADPVFALMAEIEELKAKMAEMEERHERERAEDRQTIADLKTGALNHSIHGHPDMRMDISALRETHPPEIGEAAAERHITTLFSEMQRLKIKRVKMKDAAHLMGLRERQAKKLKPLIAADHRFVILRDPRHKQRHLISIV